MDFESFRNKKCLITGGLGFIGSAIAHSLVMFGAKVTILDACLEPYGWNFANILEIKNKIDFVKGDVVDLNLVEGLIKGVDYVFNLAGQVSRIISMKDPYRDITTNCIGMMNVLEACRTNNLSAKVLFASSRGVTGEPIYLPVDEEHPDNPTDIYGINKLTSEKYHLLYHQVYGLRTVSLRLNNVYGPRCQMKYGHYGVLNLFIRQALMDEEITVFGDGHQTRDYIYINDVVNAFLSAALSESSNGNLFCISSGTETIFIDMVNKIVKTVGRGRIIHKAFPDLLKKVDIKKFVASYKKANKTFGWEPKIDLEKGIEQTVQFYRKTLNKYL